MIKFKSFQDYITNCDNTIDSADYWEDLKKLNPESSYFNEPDWGNIEDRKRCYIVAKICYLFPTATQKWMFDNKYISKIPYFVGDIKNGKLRLLTVINTPVEFKIRNVFIDREDLIRV